MRLVNDLGAFTPSPLIVEVPDFVLCLSVNAHMPINLLNLTKERLNRNNYFEA